MIVPINFGSSPDPKLPPALARISNDEIVLVELQGALDITSSTTSERDGKLVGTLTVDEAGKKSTLTIGNHLLEGEVVSVKKPIAILVRSEQAPSSTPMPQTIDRGIEENSDKQMEVDEEGDYTAPSENTTMLSATSWNITALVKRKIIFSKRPMPIVHTSQSKKTGSKT